MKQISLITLTTLFLSLIFGNKNHRTNIIAEQWNETELEFLSASGYQNPYTDVDFWVEFHS
jgi:hypothetical protein